MWQTLLGTVLRNVKARQAIPENDGQPGTSVARQKHVYGLQ